MKHKHHRAKLCVVLATTLLVGLSLAGHTRPHPGHEPVALAQAPAPGLQVAMNRGQFSGPLAADAGQAGLYLPLLLRRHDQYQLSEVWFNYTNANFVIGMAFDRETGELWAPSAGGVVRWDTRTETYTRYTAIDGLLSNSVYAVAVDKRGNKWIGTRFGASQLRPDGTWKSFAASDGLGDGIVTAIAADESGNVWFGTTMGKISRRDLNGRWAIVGVTSDDVHQIAIDRRGNIWIAAGDGVYRLSAENQQLRHYEFLENATDIRSVATDVEGNKWFGSYFEAGRNFQNEKAVVIRLAADDETWTSYTSADGLPNGRVLSIGIDAAGDKWFGTGVWYSAKGGLSRLSRDGTLTHYPMETWVTALIPDPAGGLWIGTYGKGILSANNSGRPYAISDGPASNVVRAVAVDGNDNIWFGLSTDLTGGGNGVSRLSPTGEWTTFSVSNGLAGGSVDAIAIDAQDNKWFGTRGGVSRLSADNQTWTTFTTANGLADNSVWAAAIDAQGNKWFGTDGGVSRLAADNISWTTFTTTDGLANNEVRAIAIDAQGNKWFGTYKDGVSRLAADNRIWTTYTTDDGLAHNSVYAVAIDAQGNKWFGTEAGVSRLTADDRAWTTFTTRQGLGDDRVHAIAVDPSGDIWFGTGQVLVGNPAVSLLHRDGTWTTYRSQDGVGSDEVDAIAIDQAGSKWFGTFDGGVSRLAMVKRGSPGRILPGATPTPAAPGADTACEGALRLDGGPDVTAQIDRAGEVNVFVFTVPEVFSRVELRMPDPEDRLSLSLHRSCDTISSVRHISSALHIRGEQRLVFDVLSQPGTYYVAISPKAGSYVYPIRYRLHFGLSHLDPRTIRTLILTHEPRVRSLFGLSEDAPELRDWRQKLDELATDPSVGGLVFRNIQTETADSALRAAYGAWMADENSASKANAVAMALRNWIWQQRRQLPNLRYIVLAGDDRVIPHLRLPIAPVAPEAGRGPRDDGWLAEDTYLAEGTLAADTPLGSALAVDMTLTDDVYGAAGPLSWQGQELHLPELPVGRLVERPSDMTAVMDTFVRTGGVLTVTHSLVAGYDFMQDATAEGDADLARAGLSDSQRTRLLGPTWTADQLRQQLFGTGRAHNDLVFLAAHAKHYLHDTPNNGFIQADEVATATGTDARGTLVYAVACHAGLNAPGESHPRPLDFPEAWARRGATFIGSTGWAYGLADAAAYEERLMADFTQEIAQPGGIAVGDALVAAKQRYYLEHDLNHIHVKTLAATMLYGLPMLRVHIQGAPTLNDLHAADTFTADSPALAPQTVRALRQTGPTTYMKTSIFPLGARQPVNTPRGSFYTLSGQQPRAEAGEPLQPKLTVVLGEIDRDRQVLQPRGLVLTRAGYTDVSPFQPLIQRAGVLGGPRSESQPAPVFSAPSWYPTVPVSLRWWEPTEDTGTVLVGLGRSEARALIYGGQYLACRRTERLFDEIQVDEYYSADEDRVAPVIESVTETAVAGAKINVAVQASDVAGIARVAVAYDDGHGRWTSVDLDEAGGRWQGQIPADSPYLVQAVDTSGNVSIDNRDGRYYGPPAACP